MGLNHRSLYRIVNPAVEPVTAADMDIQVRLDGSQAEIVDVQFWISAARDWLERYSGRAFITQTWAATFEQFPGGWLWNGPHNLRLPIGPVQLLAGSPSSPVISYVDADGITQAVAADVYRFVPGSETIHLAAGKAWPAIQAVPEAVTVTWVAGYGDTAADVPETSRQAIRMLAAAFYERRSVTIEPEILDFVLDLVADRRWAVA